MNLFGGSLPVITVAEVLDYASRSEFRIRLEICPCRELGKLVVRVVGLASQGQEPEPSRLLVDTGSEEYFVVGRNASGIRRKIERHLRPIRNRVDISQREDGILRLFQGGAVTETGNSTQGNVGRFIGK